MRDIVVIYHGNCADGFTGCFIAYKALTILPVWQRFNVPFEGEQRNVQYVSGVYNQPPPDVTDKDIYLIDFSYPRKELELMLEQANSIIILDHHDTAIKALSDLEHPKLTKVFDYSRSGAMIAWDYFFPNKEAPQLLKHVQDRDLWKFELPNTKEVQASVFSYPYTFEAWNTLFNSDISELAKEGMAIQRKHMKDIEELILVTKRKMIIGGYEVEVVNVPYTMGSDAAHILAKTNTFGAYYYDKPNERTFGLRSIGDMDVGAIAKSYGGGGHKNASGFPRPQGWEGDGIVYS